MELTGLIGKKLGHSLSPQIHQRFYRITDTPGCYELFETPKDGLGPLLDCLESDGYTGVNVTIPYKSDVMPFLDDISAEAAAIGAVNTIHFHDGKRSGHNTDYYGLMTLFEKNSIAIHNTCVVILGSGGAAKCAHRLVQDMGAKDIYVASRSPQAAKNTDAVGYDALDKLSTIDVLINTTPVGMSPDTHGCPVSDDVIKKSENVVDIIYNPAETVLLRKAKMFGKKAANGLLMLSAQALKAQEIWTGQTYNATVYDNVFAHLKRITQKTNIVLIGMPGSGKTTIGKHLAERKGMAFADTDDLIEKDHGPIPDIFSNEGEPVFREYEFEAAQQTAALCDTVISTGGGIILHERNMRILEETGIIVFLDRPLDKLLRDTDMSTRPLLADGKAALIALYEKRHPLYQKYAQMTPDNTSDIDACIDDIINKLEES